LNFFCKIFPSPGRNALERAVRLQRSPMWLPLRQVQFLSLTKKRHGTTTGGAPARGPCHPSRTPPPTPTCGRRPRCRLAPAGSVGAGRVGSGRLRHWTLPSWHVRAWRRYRATHIGLACGMVSCHYV
jgi:hypothetical protein